MQKVGDIFTRNADEDKNRQKQLKIFTEGLTCYGLMSTLLRESALRKICFREQKAFQCTQSSVISVLSFRNINCMLLAY